MMKSGLAATLLFLALSSANAADKVSILACTESF